MAPALPDDQTDCHLVKVDLKQIESQRCLRSRSKDLTGMRFSRLVLVAFLGLLIFPPTLGYAGTLTDEALSTSRPRTTRPHVTAEHIILTTPGQEAVTVTTQGCLQTEQCRSSMGVCVGVSEENPEGTVGMGWDGIDCWYWCRHRSKACSS